MYNKIQSTALNPSMWLGIQTYVNTFYPVLYNSEIPLRTYASFGGGCMII